MQQKMTNDNLLVLRVQLR